MNLNDQGTHNNPRYTVIPLTLCFLTHADDVLLLMGAPNKRLWAGRLNGVGGHIEADEDPLSGARREVLEETGLQVDTLSLRAVVHVGGSQAVPGDLLFVYVAAVPTRDVRPGAEGTLAWYPLADVLSENNPLRDVLVGNLPYLLPRILGPGWSGELVYAHDSGPSSGVQAKG